MFQSLNSSKEVAVITELNIEIVACELLSVGYISSGAMKREECTGAIHLPHRTSPLVLIKR